VNDLEAQIETGKAIGANTDYLSAQSFIAQNELFTAIYLITGEGDDAFTKIRKIGLDCRDKLLTEDFFPEKTVETVDFVKVGLNDLNKLQIVLVVYKNGVSHCSRFGGGQIYLVRGEKVLEISRKLISQKMISGKLHTGDEIFMINNRLSEEGMVESWDPSLLQDISETPLDLLEEEVESFLQRTSIISPIAITALRLPPEKTEETEFLPPEESVDQPVDYISPPHEEVSKPARRLPIPRFGFGSLFSSKKIMLFLIIVVILIILAVIFGTSTVKKQTQKNTQITGLMSASKNNFNLAQNLKDSDPGGARNALNQAKQEISEALKIDPNNSQAKSWQEQINSQASQVLKQYQITDFPVFLDLGLVKPNFSTQRLSFSMGKMAFLDLSQKTLVVIAVADKNPKYWLGNFNLDKHNL
jgi:hypothetical protein